MKIGILTFHMGHNYGGVLQCYALQQLLTNYGHEVEVIDYRPRYGYTLRSLVGKLHSVHSPKVLYHLLCEKVKFKTLTAAEIKIRQQEILSVFDEFRHKYLHLSPRLYTGTIGEYANVHYDAVVVGSDQVWTSLYDDVPVFFMGWKPKFQGRKISYAACSAYSSVAGRRANVLKHLLEQFDIVTVRDNTTAYLVTSLTGKTPSIVPDPTLLYAYEEFQETPNVAKEPYILTYLLGDEIKGGNVTALNKIRNEVGNLPIYAISAPNDSSNINHIVDKVYRKLSPGEWVVMFRHATFVYTDSFHAIMFSLKFGIPFVAYYRNMVRSSRLLDLKNRGIDTIYGSVEEIKIKPVVFGSINTLLNGFQFRDVFDKLYDKHE